MSSDKGQIISNLEVVYQRALKSKTDRVFFQSIFDYIEAFDQEPSLVRVNKEIVELADKDLKVEIDLEETVQKEILKVHKEVEVYLKTHETGSRAVVEHMQKVTDAWKGDLISSAGKTNQMYDDLTYALMILAKQDGDKYLQFCRKYGKIHDNASVANWANVSVTYPKWKEECTRNKRLTRFKIWHAWNEIVVFHNWFTDYEIERDKLLKSNKFMELGYVNEKFRAIQAAITGEPLENKSVIEIKRDEYQRYLDMIHQFIKKHLIQQNSLPESKMLICEYNSSSGLLTIEGQDLSFIPKRVRGLILGLFLKSKLSRKKRLHWEEIIDEIEGRGAEALTPGQKRRRVFYAIEGINDRVLKKFQVNPLFSYDDGYISLNSQLYL
jgi:hypothetical protein